MNYGNVSTGELSSLAHVIVFDWLEGNWVHGHTLGRRKRMEVEMKVFASGSVFGINNGRISKLSIWHGKGKKITTLVNYDRGWDIRPDMDSDAYRLTCALTAALDDILRMEDDT
jgi:hypothetical protein